MNKNKKKVDIAQLGEKVLRQQASLVVDFNSDEIINVILRMKDILSNSNGVGLAAPQIFKSLAIIIVASQPSKRYPLAPKMKPTLMINPSFETLSDNKTKDWEGCLSIPGIRALVPRYTKLKINYFDEQGQQLELIAEDFIARIFQHEYDHLNGLVYLDRVEDNKDIISESEFQKLIEQQMNKYEK